MITTYRARQFSRSKCSRSQQLQSDNPLIAKPLTVSPNFAMDVSDLRLCSFPFSYSTNVAHLYNIATVGTTFKVSSYDSVGTIFEPISFPATSGCATCYAIVWQIILSMPSPLSPPPLVVGENNRYRLKRSLMFRLDE